ncbi:lipoprotein [Streptomyces thermolineatus]|uniref:Lipoprotein n=1 Tax=Streptomyces thermolineatus TaxID=44033 RepID=A0ABP5Z235_9ACTN
MLETPSKSVARWVAAVLVAVLPTAACNVGEEAAKVSVNRIVGTWTARTGETLIFSADRTLVSFGLDSEKLAETDCPGGRAEGTWAFFGNRSDGLYSTSEEAKSGSKIGLYYTRPFEETCWMDLMVVDGGETLCATDDPDVPCSLDVRFTRRK